jgi:hypothetical protein
MRKLITVGVAVAALVLGGAVPAFASTVACGSTPGFCPNPPTNNAQADPKSWTQGVDGDF